LIKPYRTNNITGTVRENKNRLLPSHSSFRKNQVKTTNTVVGIKLSTSELLL